MNDITISPCIAVVGLGYVGMPLAVEFAEKGLTVIGFDTNIRKIELYQNGVDPTNEIGDHGIKSTTVEFTYDPTRLKAANFIIVAVPTPVNDDHTPDLKPVIGASTIVGQNLSPNTIVCFESTVYPGITENVCAPIIERESGLICGKDFKIAYSPERINPGDKVHKLNNIRKIVSGMDQDTCNIVQAVYNKVVDVGTYPVSNIKTAEAIKVVENSQRDINIAFMNELAMIFDKLGIDTNEVINGMNTKWNALGFRPGLVGGHCIGVDPYYLVHLAEQIGYTSKIVSAGRMVNDSMGKYIADTTIKQLVHAGKAPKQCKIAILGMTFKENCPDVRNSKVYDIITTLNEYGVTPHVVDPWANQIDVQNEYHINLSPMDDLTDLDCLIVAVAHNEFKSLSITDICNMFKDTPPSEHVLIDVKGLFNINELNDAKLRWWRL